MYCDTDNESNNTLGEEQVLLANNRKAERRHDCPHAWNSLWYSGRTKEL